MRPLRGQTDTSKFERRKVSHLVLRNGLPSGKGRRSCLGGHTHVIKNELEAEFGSVTIQMYYV